MTAWARTALWLLKSKACPVSGAGTHLPDHVGAFETVGRRRISPKGLMGNKMQIRLGKSSSRAFTPILMERGRASPSSGNFSTRKHLDGMCWSCQRRYLASERGHRDEDKKTRPKLVESTRKLRQQVQSRLANLTPHENIYTVPNILTFSRLIAAPAIGFLVLHDYHAWAVGLFAYAGITDLIDGYIARRWKLQTVVGSVIDPMADKTLMFILTICLAMKGAIPCTCGVP